MNKKIFIKLVNNLHTPVKTDPSSPHRLTAQGTTTQNYNKIGETTISLTPLQQEER
jgi:hypothetical protein